MQKSKFDDWMGDRRWVGDLGVAAIVALVMVPWTLWMGSRYLGSGGLVLVPLGLAAVAFRRLYPTQAVMGGVAVLLLSTLASYRQPSALVVIVPVLAHAASRYGTPRLRQFTIAAGVLGSFLGPVVWFGGFFDQVMLFAVVACAASFGTGYLLGDRQRVRDEQVRADLAQAREHAAMLATQDRQRTEMSVAAERVRIARDLHDIVAHSLSVVVIQAQGARAAVDAKPDVAGPVLDTIAETARSALGELRYLVGVLRSGEAEDPRAEYAPAQGIADVPVLVENIRAAGLVVTLESDGQPRPLPPGLELAVYRVVQESLTNVLKHAGPGVTVAVRLQFWDSAVQVEVTDDGRGCAGDGEPGGHGLIGMRERVAAFGGELAAGPRTGGGFAVRAHLPLLATKTRDLG